MDPIIKWSGGKRGELGMLRPWYPSRWSLYVEPFAGGASAFFDLEPSQALLSDTHEELMNFYAQLKNGNGPKIYALMAKYENNETNYYFVRDFFKPKTDVERAFVFFYIRKTCYRGMLRYNSQGKFNIPFGWYRTYSYEELRDARYVGIFKNTKILVEDFRSIFTRFNSENNFVFLDPPYDCVFKKYMLTQFGKDRHEELAELFKTTKNKCLLVISETPFIKNLYRGYIRTKYTKNYAFKIHSGRVNKNINKNHLVITNYSENS